jgi:hypothetical protein
MIICLVIGFAPKTGLGIVYFKLCVSIKNKEG